MTAPDLSRRRRRHRPRHAGRRRRHRRARRRRSIDDNQVLAYDLAHAAAAVDDRPGPARLRRQGRRRGPHHLRLRRRRRRRPGRQAVRPRGRVGRRARRPRRRPRVRRRPTATPSSSPSLADTDGPRHLDGDFEMVQDTFRRFAEDKIAPDRRAHPPRRTPTSPRTIIAGLAEMGALRPVDPRGVRRLRARAARASTSAWSSPPRSCPAARSAPAAR